MEEKKKPMSYILVVTGSVRPNNANEKVVPLVIDELEKHDAQVKVASLKDLQLPFFDAPLPPSSPDFVPEHESVKAWTSMVAEASAVVFVTPEYNHTASPVQLNAIDWIGKEWVDKIVGLIGYGWTSGAGQAHATLREALAVNLKATIVDEQANLFFMKDLNPDGTVLDKEAVQKKIASVVTGILS